jgi:UDP-glucose 4-epimerase
MEEMKNVAETYKICESSETHTSQNISFSSSSSVYRVYSSLSVILQRDSQDKSPAGQYLQLKTG